MAQRKKPAKASSSKSKRVAYKAKSAPKKKQPVKMNTKKLEMIASGLDKLNKNFKCLVVECEKALDMLTEPIDTGKLQVN